jgi:Domain of unknown function (DUF1905)
MIPVGNTPSMFEIEFEGEVVRWEDGAWHFVFLPEDLSEHLHVWAGGMKGRWGSVKVAATIGATTWETSLFPSKSRRGVFLLPLKAPVRKAEGLAEGDEVTVTLRV